MTNLIPNILLLGGGYVLQKVASLLTPTSFVITSRNPKTVSTWQAQGFLAEEADTLEPQTIMKITEKYPSLQTLVDSVPPVFLPSEASTQREAELRIVPFMAFQKIIYLSTTGVFGVDDGSWVNEETPCKAQHSRAIARVIFEEIYRKVFPQTVVLRIPAIYGPGRGIGNSLKKGRYPLIGDGSRWSNRIQVEDLAKIIDLVCKMENPPAVLCASDSEPTPSIDVVRYYCNTFHFPFPASISIEDAQARGLHTMLSNQRVSSKYLRENLNFTLTYPTFREGASSEFCFE